METFDHARAEDSPSPGDALWKVCCMGFAELAGHFTHCKPHLAGDLDHPYLAGCDDSLSEYRVKYCPFCGTGVIGRAFIPGMVVVNERPH